MVDICKRGGYAAIFDFNEDSGAEVVQELGKSVKFFQADVTSTESIEKAVKGALEWVKETEKEIAGVIAAAGVATPAKVCKNNCIRKLYMFYIKLWNLTRPDHRP